jgi:hypothetical protein
MARNPRRDGNAAPCKLAEHGSLPRRRVAILSILLRELGLGLGDRCATPGKLLTRERDALF